MAVLFGTLKIGAVVVMVNPELKPEAIDYFYRYTRARVVVTHRDTASAFKTAARDARHLKTVLVLGDGGALDDRLAQTAGPVLESFPTHRDDAAIWLFSGGTTGQPKAVVQTHASFANTTECYAKGVIGYTERDVTVSVPKLYFGYATGSNLLFPFAVGATTVLFPEAATPEVARSGHATPEVARSGQKPARTAAGSTTATTSVLPLTRACPSRPSSCAPGGSPRPARGG